MVKRGMAEKGATQVYKPDYDGGSIVNLMSSIARARGARTPYAELDLLPRGALKGQVALLIIDGLGYEWLTRHGKGSFLAEHLLGSMTSVFPSTTAAAMTAFYTGVAPQQHGLTGWFMKFREIGMVSVPLRGYTRSGALPFDGVIDMAGLIKAEPFAARIRGGAHVILPAEYIGTPYNDVVSAGAKVSPYSSLSGCMRETAAALASGAGFVGAYWPEFDHSCHLYGTAHPKTLAHFRELDRAVASLARRLKGVTLIVTADHGLTDTRKVVRLADHPRLSDCLALPLCGEPRAAYCYVRPSKAKEFESLVRSELKGWTLRRGEDLIADGWYGKGKAEPWLFQRVGDYVLFAPAGTIIRDTLLGEVEKRLIGNHGGVSAEEMLVPLIVIEK